MLCSWGRFSQTESKRGSVKQQPHVHRHKWTKPDPQLKMTSAQDSFSKNMKRKSLSKDKSKGSLVSVRQAQGLVQQ